MRTSLVGWKNGPWIRAASLWLDAPPVGRGLRFVSSCLAPAGRRSDRAFATAFTGAYHFGPERPFLTAPEEVGFHLGAAEVRLLPGGNVQGAAQLLFRSDEGGVLYTVASRVDGTTLSKPARFLPAEVWLIRFDEPPGEGPSWEDWLQGLALELSRGAELRVPAPWLAGELSAGLTELLDDPPELDISERRLARWRRAGGELRSSKGGPRITLVDGPEDRVVLINERGEEQRRIPAAPSVDALCAAVAKVRPGELLLTGAGAGPWAEALTAAGMFPRILGGDPPRLL